MAKDTIEQFLKKDPGECQGCHHRGVSSRFNEAPLLLYLCELNSVSSSYMN